MARFRNQVSKGIAQELETRNQKPETNYQEPASNNQEPGNVDEDDNLSIYNESDMESVNVAGFKVPYIVREHWKKECREKRVKLSPILKEFLVKEFGLPPGITLEDLR